MRMCVAARLLFSFGLIRPVSLSLPIVFEPVEGSGHFQDSSGSGSGDWSDHDVVTAMKGLPEVTHWPPMDWDSEFTVVGNSKSFLENQEIISGLIAGGITGLILAVLLSALLICKWKMKHDGGFILGRQIHREEAVF